MKWNECSMIEAMAHIKSHELRENPIGGSHIEPSPDLWADVVWFTDGTAVAVKSEWSGPLSEVTPDIDAESPKWWIYS